MPSRKALALFGTLLLAIPTGAYGQVSKIYGGPAPVPPEMVAAFLETMASDLRNLVTSQEAYFSDNNTYASRFALARQKGASIQPSPGVTLTIVYSTATGWTGRATHDWLGGMSCVIEVGGVPPSRQLKTTGGKAAKEEGRPTCDTP